MKNVRGPYGIQCIWIISKVIYLFRDLFNLIFIYIHIYENSFDNKLLNMYNIYFSLLLVPPLHKKHRKILTKSAYLNNKHLANTVTFNYFFMERQTTMTI